MGWRKSVAHGRAASGRGRFTKALAALVVRSRYRPESLGAPVRPARPAAPAHRPRAFYQTDPVAALVVGVQGLGPLSLGIEHDAEVHPKARDVAAAFDGLAHEAFRTRIVLGVHRGDGLGGQGRGVGPGHVYPRASDRGREPDRNQRSDEPGLQRPPARLLGRDAHAKQVADGGACPVGHVPDVHDVCQRRDDADEKPHDEHVHGALVDDVLKAGAGAQGPEHAEEAIANARKPDAALEERPFGGGTGRGQQRDDPKVLDGPEGPLDKGPKRPHPVQVEEQVRQVDVGQGRCHQPPRLATHGVGAHDQRGDVPVIPICQRDADGGQTEQRGHGKLGG